MSRLLRGGVSLPGHNEVRPGSRSLAAALYQPQCPVSLPLPPSVTARYCPYVSNYYRFKRGDPVTVVSGRYKGHSGVVDSAVFQRSVDYPDDQHPGYHVVLGSEPRKVVTVRFDQVELA